ncbi:hypothetical protein EDC04DRAFT_2623461, partial [Pisolithus marmoratus]
VGHCFRFSVCLWIIVCIINDIPLHCQLCTAGHPIKHDFGCCRHTSCRELQPLFGPNAPPGNFFPTNYGWLWTWIFLQDGHRRDCPSVLV